MVVLLEDLTETILIENGVSPLLGVSLVTDTLGLSWKSMERMFVKCASEFSRSKPKEDEILIESGTQATLPENFISLKAVRYGILMEYPRYIFEKLTEEGLQWNPSTRTLKVFPPIGSVRVSFTRGLNITNNVLITDTFYTVEGEDIIEDMMRATYRPNTLSIIKNGKTMEEVSRSDTEVELNGELGSGTLNLTTREFTLNLDDTSAGQVRINYYPKYKALVDLDMEIGDKIFSKLYAANLLLSISSLMLQATQEPLHNIDLTSDDLQARALALSAEVKKELKSSISFAAMIGE